MESLAVASTIEPRDDSNASLVPAASSAVFHRRPRTTLEVVPSDPAFPLTLLDVRADSFTYPLHYHPEIELTLIVQGRGQRYVGDSIQSFEPGDLVLVGAHTPHSWQSERRFGHSVRALVIQFPEELFGSDFLDRPLGRPLRELFERAQRGLCFSEQVRARTIERLKAIFHPSHTNLDRVGILLQILSDMTPKSQQVVLGLGNSPPVGSPQSHGTLEKVLTHIDQHIDRALTQRAVAKMAGLSTAGFSRFFSRNLGKTFVTYVAELRTKRACELLLDNQHSIADIARLSGFHNLANFNRRFFRFKGMTPSEYRRLARSAPRAA
jgi:AraC-like DNA-binding protein/mannose-6-phosphate isomerase-like protein (cupin superfamily)